MANFLDVDLVHLPVGKSIRVYRRQARGQSPEKDFVPLQCPRCVFSQDILDKFDTILASDMGTPMVFVKAHTGPMTHHQLLSQYPMDMADIWDLINLFQRSGVVEIEE